MPKRLATLSRALLQWAMSALALETRELVETGSPFSATVFALGTLLLSVLALMAGVVVARALFD